MPKIESNDIKLFNILVQYDVYVAARTPEEAKEAVLGLIQGGEPPQEIVQYAIRSARDIRNDWRDQKPFVAGPISDEDRKPYTNLTTGAFFEKLSSPTKD